ncbi:MAG: enoyl-CoA hydratase/isomerase family protein [Deltaproteobacteria bacterium]|nr:enoyl-CoA hydratase/isomerase family protein [Deltaproteobacteria bacterium]
MGDELGRETRGAAVVLTLRREERRNALSFTLLEALQEALARAAEDPAVAVVCLTGAGEKAFCAGLDLAELATPGDPAPRVAQAYAAVLQRMLGFPKPLVARVGGPCLAGGVGLVLCCHLSLARADVYFSLPELDLGVFPMMVAGLLERRVGPAAAMDWVLTGRRIPAEEAAARGLVTRAVPAALLDSEVDDLLSLLAGRGPDAVCAGFQALRETRSLPASAALEPLLHALGRTLSSGT